MIPGRYRALWRQRWVPVLLMAGALARLPLQMYSFALLLLVVESTGSYVLAGLVAAAAAVGYGVGVPVQGRLVDRYGQTVPLTAAAVVNGAAFAAVLLGSSRVPGPVLIGLAVLVGLSLPPVAAAQRALWSDVLPDEGLRRTALAVDVMILDLGLIVGPLIVSGIALVADPIWALALSALALCGGTLWFARLEPSRARRGDPLASRDLWGALRSPAIQTLVVTALCGGRCSACCASLSSASPMRTRSRPRRALRSPRSVPAVSPVG